MAWKLSAYADRAGVISFGMPASAPKGLITFARGWERKIKDAVEVNARHAYDGVTLLVPGVPEAADDDAALDALDRFAALIDMRLEGQPGWPA